MKRSDLTTMHQVQMVQRRRLQVRHCRIEKDHPLSRVLRRFHQAYRRRQIEKSNSSFFRTFFLLFDDFVCSRALFFFFPSPCSRQHLPRSFFATPHFLSPHVSNALFLALFLLLHRTSRSISYNYLTANFPQYQET